MPHLHGLAAASGCVRPYRPGGSARVESAAAIVLPALLVSGSSSCTCINPRYRQSACR